VHPQALAGGGERGAVDAADEASARGVEDAVFADLFQGVGDVEEVEGGVVGEGVEEGVAAQQGAVGGLFGQPGFPRGRQSGAFGGAGEDGGAVELVGVGP